MHFGEHFIEFGERMRICMFDFPSMIEETLSSPSALPAEQAATAGTFGFRRELLKETSYEDDAEMAEEKHFLKNYTIPFVQLNPMKSILCLLLKMLVR